MNLEHSTRKFAHLVTLYFKHSFRFWRKGFCTDSQPRYNSDEIWDETTQSDEEGINSNQDEMSDSQLGTGSRLKKYAILLSYCGKGYFGLQRQSDVETVEEDLLDAMRKAEVISQEYYENPFQLHFQRASRTDKGVSALRQIISTFLPTHKIDHTTVKKINKYLPEQIRVMGMKRVTKAFDAKRSCNARLYSYMLPTFAFSPVDVLCTEAYRLPKGGVDQINRVLREYEGRHNFYNFTNHRSYEDTSCFRHMYLCKCGQPFTAGGLEFVVIRIKGQSFMLHQIRKMVAVVIGIVRGLADTSTIVKAFGKEKIDLPLAPGLGLMLEEIYYDNYNWKCGDGAFEPIVWDEYQDELYHFRENYIRPIIVETEVEEKSMLKWLQETFCHTYAVRDTDKQNPYYVSRLYGAAVRLKVLNKESKTMTDENENALSETDMNPDMSRLSSCSNFVDNKS